MIKRMEKKMKDNYVYDPKNEKIVKLTLKSKDKNLSREERKEVLEKLNWEKFRADKRPIMPLRKFKILDAIVYFGDMFIFGYMGIAENLHHKGFSAADIFMVIMVVLLICMCVAYISAHQKYKIEPADELAKQDMNKASTYAFYILVAIGAAFAFIKSIINMDGTTVIVNESMMYLLASILFLYDFLANMIFVYLDCGKGEAEEEE